MKKAFAFTLCILVHFCILSSNSHSQNRYSGINYEISIPFAESRFVETKYITTGWTKSIPPHEFKAFDSWLYHITLKLRVSGKDLKWKTPIGVILTLPDGSKHSEIINNDAFPLYPDNLYEFSFNIDTKRKGWVNIEMNALKEWDNLNVPNVRFIGSSVYLD